MVSMSEGRGRGGVSRGLRQGDPGSGPGSGPDPVGDGPRSETVFDVVLASAAREADVGDPGPVEDVNEVLSSAA